MRRFLFVGMSYGFLLMLVLEEFDVALVLLELFALLFGLLAFSGLKLDMLESMVRFSPDNGS